MIMEEKLNQEKYWYVLFVKAGCENKVISQLKKYFEGEPIIPFIMTIEMFHKYAKGKVEKEIKIMFPGYVFIETNLASVVFVGMINKFIAYHDSPLRLLKYGNSCEFAMRIHEKSLLLSFCNKDSCIEVSAGMIRGNKITVTLGPLKNRESIIKKIDRSRRKAVIAVDFMERHIPITVGLDIYEKMP